MKLKIIILIVLGIISLSFNRATVDKKASQTKNFNIEKDLLLVQFDCKTDVDDLHTAAALAMLMANNAFSKINYHAIAGTYGIQEGLYVPPNDLFQLAFDDNWTDAHGNLNEAIEKVKNLVKITLAKNGDIWIAEAGQSDFTAQLIKAIKAENINVKIAQRFHVVQHSDWNEKVTSPEALQFVKNNAIIRKFQMEMRLEMARQDFEILNLKIGVKKSQTQICTKYGNSPWI